MHVRMHKLKGMHIHPCTFGLCAHDSCLLVVSMVWVLVWGRFCSCSDWGRSTMESSLSSTRLPSTCCDWLNPTLLGGKFDYSTCVQPCLWLFQDTLCTETPSVAICENFCRICSSKPVTVTVDCLCSCHTHTGTLTWRLFVSWSTRGGMVKWTEDALHSLTTASLRRYIP